jgi:thymidylate kinase
MKKPCKVPASRGLWIAFLGPDGVGKSSVIEQLQHRLEPEFDDIILFHFRPRFRRHGAQRPAVTCPHAHRPRGALISAGKLIYWLVDCWYGYLTVIRPGKQREGLLIFDRYYPDILVDPLRYRLPQRGATFARWLATLAPQPDLYVLLDAPAETVQQRKAELPLSESHRQRIAYLKVFEGIRNKLLVNANRPVGEVAHNIGVAIRTLYPNSLLDDRQVLPTCWPLS